jgi:hypothetical protein
MEVEMKNWISLVSLVGLLVLGLGLDAEARGRRHGGCGPGGCNVAAAPTAQPAATTQPTVAAAPAAKPGHTELTNRDAQGVANIMASRGVVGHFGGNPGYEGCGMASTRDGAYRICCYANSGMRDADVGFARGRNGMWFCCRRYR